MEDIKIFAKGQNATEADELNLWDIKFWSERLRESSYHINEVGLSLSLSLCVHASVHACVKKLSKCWWIHFWWIFISFRKCIIYNLDIA